MTEASPPLPRRIFLAAGLAAVTAAAAVGLGVAGAISAPETDVFQFSRGTSFAAGEENRLRGHLATAVQDNGYKVIIVGHSGNQGDAAANLALSNDRAAKAAEIAADMGIDPANVQVTGVGGGDPVAKPDDVSDRAFQALLARVEVTLQVRR